VKRFIIKIQRLQATSYRSYRNQLAACGVQREAIFTVYLQLISNPYEQKSTLDDIGWLGHSQKSESVGY
jgi:hypothetical protein